MNARLRDFLPLVGLPVVLLLVMLLLPFSPAPNKSPGASEYSDFLSYIRTVDFRAFYASGIMVRTERHSLYNIERTEQVQARVVGHASKSDSLMPFLYPPFVALFFIPFARLPYSAAYVLMLLVNLALLALLLWLLVRRLHLTAAQTRILLLVTGIAAPVYDNLVLGQLSFITALLLALFVTDLLKSRETRPGLWTGLLFFKPPMIVIPALVLLWRRQWRALAIASGLFMALAVWSLALVGSSGISGLLAAWRFMGTSSEALSNLVKMQNLRALAHALRLGDAGWLAGSAIVLGALWLVHRRQRSIGASTAPLLGTALIAVMLVLPHFHAYDLSIGLVPLALIISTMPDMSARKQRAILYSSFAASLVILAALVTGRNLPLVALLLLVLLFWQLAKADGWTLVNNRQSAAGEAR